MNTPNKLADLFNVGSTFEYEGTTYKLTEATIPQRAEFATWVENRAWEALERRQLNGGSPTLIADLGTKLTGAIAAGEYEWGGPHVMAAVRTYAGAKQLAWIVLRDQCPDIEPFEFDAIYEAKHKEIAKLIERVSADPFALSEMVGSLLGQV